MKSYKHQEAAVKRYVPAPFFGLLFDCGLGKTRTAEKIAEGKAKELGIRTVLVIAPHILMDQWAEALEQHRDPGQEISVMKLDPVKLKTKKGSLKFREFLCQK